MRKTILIIVAAVLVIASVTFAMAAKQQDCFRIKSGTILTSDGSKIKTGLDGWGYNYQGHRFSGLYCHLDRNQVNCNEHLDTQLTLKWNDDFLSNKDCNKDITLDRHLGFDSYIGSNAALNVRIKGIDESGESWAYTAKIVAKPSIDYECSLKENVEIWNDFCLTRENKRNPSYLEHRELLHEGLLSLGN